MCLDFAAGGGAFAFGRWFASGEACAVGVFVVGVDSCGAFAAGWGVLDLGQAPGVVVGVGSAGEAACSFKPLPVDRWDDCVFEPLAFFFFFFCAVGGLFVYEAGGLADLVVGVGGGHAVGVAFGEHVPLASYVAPKVILVLVPFVCNPSSRPEVSLYSKASVPPWSLIVFRRAPFSFS